MSNFIEKKIRELGEKHNRSLTETEVKSVTASFASKVAAFKGDDVWLRALDEKLAGLRLNPLRAEIEKKDLDISRVCPICGEVCDPITIMKGREAFYCAAHRVVQPAPVKTEQT